MPDGAASTYLDGLFQCTVFQDGAKVGTAAQINVQAPLTVTWDNTAKRFNITLPTSPSANTGGTARGVTTSGYQTVTLVPLALPVGSSCGFDLTVTCTEGSGPSAQGMITRSPADMALKTNGGTLSAIGSSFSYACGLPLAATTASAYSAGTLMIQAVGPHATVNGTADNGSGKVRVSVSSSTPLVNWGPGTLAVDISGIVGTTEANGTNLAATYVDSTHFDLLAISYVHAYVSGGLVVEHTPRALTWSADVQLKAIAP